MLEDRQDTTAFRKTVIKLLVAILQQVIYTNTDTIFVPEIGSVETRNAQHEKLIKEVEKDWS